MDSRLERFIRGRVLGGFERLGFSIFGFSWSDD